MKTFIATIICIICCINNIKINEKSFYVKEENKQNFKSFISKFDVYCKSCIDNGFFLQRNERTGEMYTEICKQEFSTFIPYDNKCNCEKDEFYYRPCYRIDKVDFYIVAMLASCDIPVTDGYPFDANLLVTYDKAGNIIDYKIVGIGSDVQQYKMEFGEKENELTVTQQSFTEIKYMSNEYTGKCDVSIYRIKINDDGTIDKEIISEYEDNLRIEL